MKHTPGPWKAEGSSVAALYPDGRLRIEIVERAGGTGNISGANAKLIAAAPDLLDCCIHLLAVLKANQLNGKLRLYRQAQEAVKKAKG